MLGGALGRTLVASWRGASIDDPSSSRVRMHMHARNTSASLIFFSLIWTFVRAHAVNELNDCARKGTKNGVTSTFMPAWLNDFGNNTCSI